MAEKKETSSTRWVVIITVLIVIGFSVLFVFEFIAASQGDGDGAAQNLTEDTYLTEVDALLVDADPENGALLVEQYECHVCHIQGGGQVAPLFEGVADRAAERRSPLAARAYIYESIAYPAVYIVEGYSNSMLANYATRLSEKEFGDIISYLLTQSAEQ